MDFKTIMDELIKFRDDTDWKQFLTSENLTISLIRAANLLQTFEYKNKEEIDLITKNEKEKIKERLAEIIVYLFYLCYSLDISCESLEVAIYSKLIKESTNLQLDEQKEPLQSIPNTKLIKFKPREEL